jgi:hypothetical protein
MNGKWVKGDASEILEPTFARPVGAPKKNRVWNESTGQWDSVDINEITAHGSIVVKRPRGPPPAGKHWDHDSGCWVCSSTEDDGSLSIKRPRGHTLQSEWNETVPLAAGIKLKSI